VSVTFDVADAHALPFPNRSVDVAVSLRMLMHVPDWQRCVAELCRVARWRVIVDFPARMSFAWAESSGRRLAAKAGRRTEPYRVIAESEVDSVLRSNGFHVKTVDRQFVLPIAFHKTVNSLGFTRGIERSLAAVGLRRLLGSPVTMVAER
jgi:ubiquinone/menaquinone biosynthesis C-methylase UbiE